MVFIARSRWIEIFAVVRADVAVAFTSHYLFEIDDVKENVLHREDYLSTIQTGAWSLALSSDRALRSTPPLIRRGEIAGLSRI